MVVVFSCHPLAFLATLCYSLDTGQVHTTEHVLFPLRGEMGPGLLQPSLRPEQVVPDLSNTGRRPHGKKKKVRDIPRGGGGDERQGC